MEGLRERGELGVRVARETDVMLLELCFCSVLHCNATQ